METPDYYQIKAVSNSSLKYFKRSPMHYKYFLEHPEPSSPAQVFGNLVHTLILEPDKFSEKYFSLDESQRPFPEQTFAKKENKEWLIEQKAKLGTRLMVSADDLVIASEMKEAVFQDPVALEILKAKGNIFEKENFWKEEGLNCKSKYDIWNNEFIADIKTAQNADPKEFIKTIPWYDYHRQGGMYIAGDKQGFPDYNNQKPFFFIAIEKTAPYGVSVIKLSKEFIEEGILEYKMLLKQLKQCINLDNWPGYSYKSLFDEDGIFIAQKPQWI